MTDHPSNHAGIAWAKQRLDDLDAILLQAETFVDEMEDAAQKEAGRALVRLQKSRARIEKYTNDLRAIGNSASHEAEELRDRLDAEWVEVESAFHSFLSNAQHQAEMVRSIVIARAQAQRRFWETSLSEMREQANDTVENARKELDAAITHLTHEAEKFQSRIGEVKDASDASWEAVKAGVADAKAVQDRTIRAIRAAFQKRS